MNLSWNDWKAELTNIFRDENFSKEAIRTIDWEAFKEYFDDGLWPREAFEEDMRNDQ